MTPREATLEKAVRYLSEGRLTVREAGGGRVVATCRGRGGAVYVLVYELGVFSCSCPAYARRCCHVEALRRIVDVEPDL